jgi:catechol 2,3-dioxygenase-like lactoylglutathione lyase family enzyme
MAQAVAILPADDLSVAKAFFVDVLGFRVQWEATTDGKTGLLGIERDGMMITIDAPMSGHGRQAVVSLRVNDADVYHSEWRDKAQNITAPRDEEWGARTFGVTDPSGNTIFVIGPPSSQAAARIANPAALVPMAHVQSVPRSLAFYQLLGFDVARTHVPEGLSEPVWAWLRSGAAQLMLARASDPLGVPQGVLFYVYLNDVAGFRQRLVEAGIAAGSIRYPFYCPRGEFRVTDPDGYVLMIAHT